jgi:hypothetical protein
VSPLNPPPTTTTSATGALVGWALMIYDDSADRGSATPNVQQQINDVQMDAVLQKRATKRAVAALWPTQRIKRCDVEVFHTSTHSHALFSWPRSLV